MKKLLILFVVFSSLMASESVFASECEYSEMRPFSSEVTPSEAWTKADGRSLDLYENQPLFSLLGDVYGGDMMRRRFNLPRMEDLVINGTRYSYYICTRGDWPSGRMSLAGMVRQFSNKGRTYEDLMIPLDSERVAHIENGEEVFDKINTDLALGKWTSDRVIVPPGGNPYKEVFQVVSLQIPTVQMPEVILNSEYYQKLPLYLQKYTTADEEWQCAKGGLYFALGRLDQSSLIELPETLPVSVGGVAKMPLRIYECR